jgi:putative glutathione S-transferase
MSNHAVACPSSACPQVAETVDVDACRTSYYTNLFPLNPGGIIAAGPTQEDLGLMQPVSRGGSQLIEDMFYLKPSATRTLPAGNRQTAR